MSIISDKFVLPFLFFVLVLSPLFALGSPLQKHRPDPLNHFSHYNAGFNVTNKHYWASTAFTGVYGVVIAGVWMLCGVGYGIFVVAQKLASSGSSSPSHPPTSSEHIYRYYVAVFVLVIFFTILVIIASGFVLAANQSSMKRTKRLKNTILDAGQNVQQAIRKVITGLTEIQYQLLPYDPQMTHQLNLTTHQLRRESRVIHNYVQKNGHYVNMGIQTSYIVHLVIVIVNLTLVVTALDSLMICYSASVMHLMHWHPGFIAVIFLCWILTMLCWVFTGFDFFLHNFAEDTCLALNDFEENPQNNSWSSMLPCLEPTYKNKILIEVGFVIHTFISQLNSRISELSVPLGLDQDRSKKELGIGKICDPFTGSPNYSYVPRSCPKNDVPIGNLSQILSRFTCFNDESSLQCIVSGKFIPETSYNEASAYSCSIQEIINIFPDLQDLTDCSIVKTVKDIDSNVMGFDALFVDLHGGFSVDLDCRSLSREGEKFL
ncbi:hypothetical protein ACFE04_001048 [Oxalis oulophora]